VAPEEKPKFPVPFLAGIIVVLLLLGGVYLLTRYSKQEAVREEHLPMTTSEQAYVSRIRFTNPKVSRASNFLSQEVTFVFGSVVNDGPRSIRQMEITVEFRDIFNQVVLREPRRPWGPQAPPLLGGQSREFQFNFEDVPADWNQAYPRLRIAGLLLD
jgi:hypothetical protein